MLYRNCLIRRSTFNKAKNGKWLLSKKIVLWFSSAGLTFLAVLLIYFLSRDLLCMMGCPSYSPNSRLAGVVVVVAGICIHITLGTFYTFGNMSPYMVSYLRKYSSKTDVTSQTLIWVSALTGAGQGAAMYFGGQIEKKIGPRLTVLLGGFIMSSGVALSYFAISNFWLILFTYGLLNGLGVGIAYPIPMAAAMTWWPKKKGLVAGFVVAGFGAGAAIFDQVQTHFINPKGLNPTVPDPKNSDEKYFGNVGLLHRVKTCFLILGGTYFSIQLIGSFFLASRKTEKRDEDAVTSNETEVNRKENGQHLLDADPAAPVSSKPSQLFKDKRFYMLWIMFFSLGQAVTFVGALFKSYGLTVINDDHFMAIVGSVSSPFNAAGRLFWGGMADRFSFRTAVLAMASIFAALLLTFDLTTLGGKPVFTAWVCLLFSCIGGVYALFPAATVRSFGQTHFSSNYGLIFTSQILGAFVPAFISTIKLSYSHLWFLSAGLVYIAVIIGFFFKEK
ncbi:L-lactate transporter-like [Oscarella lobularis]|uniref:L-lactate transporter-like n=1 Tax=Oscarella lobularis TaxID=121494 RepID=UPI003313C254